MIASAFDGSGGARQEVAAHSGPVGGGDNHYDHISTRIKYYIHLHTFAKNIQ